MSYLALMRQDEIDLKRRTKMRVLCNVTPKIYFITTWAIISYILRLRLKFGACYLKVVTAHTFRSFKTTCPICYLSSISKLLCCLWFTKLTTRVTIDPFFVYVFIAWGNYRLNLKYCVRIWKKITQLEKVNTFYTKLLTIYIKTICIFRSYKKEKRCKYF